jgi:tRNA (guanine-N7-)-methyltransferase
MQPKDTHFYGRRKGMPLKKGRAESLERALNEFSLPSDVLDAEIIDPVKLFGDFAPQEIAFEIGFGNGEHLVEQAARNPHVGFIGCEPFINGVSAAAKQVVERDLKNIRFYADDALPLLSKFTSGSLSQIFLLFPDPWPKTRHHKRRFIQDVTVTLFARLLKSGGVLRLATDDKNLAEWMLIHTVQNSDFVWTNASDGKWETPPADWVETRYQKKAAEQGRFGKFIDFIRV